MAYTIVGKQHLKGTSKSGKDYDFKKLFIVTVPPAGSDVIGKVTSDALCTDDIFDEVDVDCTYDKLFYNDRGVVSYVE